jgi:hypothetical protein
LSITKRSRRTLIARAPAGAGPTRLGNHDATTSDEIDRAIFDLECDLSEERYRRKHGGRMTTDWIVAAAARIQLLLDRERKSQ